MLQPAEESTAKGKGRNKGLATRGNKVSFGEFGLKATSRGRLTARQIEAARRAISRHIKRGGRIWIRIFPDKPISKKPAEVRMGNSKGNPGITSRRSSPARCSTNGRRGRDVGARGIPARGSQTSIATTFVQRLVVNHESKELSAKSEADLNKELGELYKHTSACACEGDQQLTNTESAGQRPAATSRG